MALRKSCHAFIVSALVMLCLLHFVYISRKNNAYECIFIKQDNAINMTYDGPYLPGSAGCLMPDIDAHHASVRRFEAPVEPIVCSEHAPLTYTATTPEGHQALRVDLDAVRHYHIVVEDLRCCYSVIHRVDDTENGVSPCEYFKLEIVLPLHVDYLHVRCHHKKHRVKIYQNVHAVVQRKQINYRGMQGEKPNVLLLGFDSISRQNLMRTMPLTVSHLRANNWIELHKYNKIGDNTLPNVMAILTGMDEHQLDKIVCFQNSMNFDHCPFVWTDFRRKGYLTAYAEDEPNLSTFNLNSEGFSTKPTDYYLRPFMVEAKKRLKEVKRNSGTVCLGPTSTTDILLTYTKDLLRTYTRSLFALIWINNFSHNDLNGPRAADDGVSEFMQHLKESGALNNTFVLFMSDHGARSGDIRKTYVGWLEERWPFMYIWVPEWYRAKHPDAYQNLIVNSYRLTSPFDIYLLLKDVVDDSVGKPGRGCRACPTCVSLFAPVSVERECKDAGITPHWCTCVNATDTSTHGRVVQEAAKVALNNVMKQLTQVQYSGNLTCATLTLSTIISARISGKVEEYDEYNIVFETAPGMALFDATLRYWPSNVTSQYEVMGLISRINSYAGQSECVNDKKLKLYCFCIMQ